MTAASAIGGETNRAAGGRAAGASTVLPTARGRPRRWEPAQTVIAVSLALLVGVFGVFAFLVWQAYFTTLAEGAARAQRGADLVARQTEWTLGSSLALLETFDTLLDGKIDAATPDLVARMKLAVQTLPTDPELMLFDAAGTVLPEAKTTHLPNNIADHEFFVALMRGADWRVSAQMQDASQGSAIFAIGKRLETAGQFTGSVVLVFRTAVLSRIWAELDLGARSVTSLVRDDGWVVARFPELAEPFDARNSQSYESASSGSPRGTIPAAISPADGVERIVAYTRLPELGLIAFGAVSVDAALSGLRSATYTVLLLMGPIGIALLLGSLLTARLLHQSTRTQERLAAALAHNELLFREIHHRVKNNLQSVASLLQLQPIPREIKREMALRISAMSAVHEHIYRSNNFATVPVRAYLKTLIQTIRSSHDPSIELVEDIEDLEVSKDVASPLGLIVNEVLSNAFKHAFPDRPSGRVAVTLKRGEADTGILRVDDNGVGYDPEADSGGIGRRLIGALTAQLGGTATSSGENGGHFELVFPLATRQEPAAT